MSELLTIKDLPGELHDAILDLLVGDPETLRACCLTCKLWLPRAQHNLHLHVGLSQQNRDAFCATVSRRPQLAKHVREFTLVGVERIPRPPRGLHPTAIQLLRLVDMDLSNPWVRTVVSASGPSVQRVSLRDCHALEIAAFVDLLNDFSQLKHVEVDRGHVRVFGEEVQHIPRLIAPDLLSLSLTSGDVHDLSASAVIRSFLAHPASYSKLCVLKIRLAYSDLGTLNSFLEVVGPRLRELDLGVAPGASGSDSALPLTLASCPNLLLLNLEMKLSRHHAERVDHLSWVPAVLSTIASSTLRRVKFVVKAVHASQKDLKMLDLESIGQTLSEERFASVRRVLFHVVDGFLLLGLVVPFVRGKLAELDAGGTLRCVHEMNTNKGQNR